MPLPPTPFIPDGIFFTLGIYTQQTALDSDPGDTAVHLDPCRAAGLENAGWLVHRRHRLKIVKAVKHSSTAVAQIWAASFDLELLAVASEIFCVLCVHRMCCAAKWASQCLTEVRVDYLSTASICSPA